ncbi:hypothetical protein JCM10213_003256 [Rhodosporidiobolus nylandii]
MSAHRDFQSILSALQSDKIKERTAGVQACREFLSSRRSFASLTSDRSFSWLAALQTLFHVVLTERNAWAAKKPPSAAVEKRLDDAAQLVRFCVEKSVQQVSRKTAKAVVNHLTQMIASGGSSSSSSSRDLPPYALTYLKALRAVLSHPPHLEHLDEKQWTDVVALCFSGALGDKIKIGQEFADENAMELDDDASLPRGALRNGTPRAAGSDEDELAPSASTSRGGRGKSRRDEKRTATPVEIELLHVLDCAFRAHSAPFLPYAHAILSKFLRFFARFPGETSAHLPALSALNRALQELDLNDQKSMRRIGARMWGSLVGLWQTKSAGTKEMVVVALRLLFPFVVPSPATLAVAAAGGGGGAAREDERDGARKARELYDAVLSEPGIRWREAYELDIDVLRLGVSPPSPTPSSSSSSAPQAGERAFHAQTFRLASGFDDKHAVAWATVELGAMALARVAEVGEEERGRDEMDVDEEAGSERRRGKRRKVEDPLTQLLDSLVDASLPVNTVTFRLQLLLFLIDRHWSSLSPEACHRILDTLVPLLSHPDAQIERWAFLCVAGLAQAGLPPSPASDSLLPRAHTSDFASPSKRRAASFSPAAPPASPWEQIWQLSLRRLSSAEVCRCAAHTANTLLAQDLVPAVLLSDSLDSFAKELDLQHQGGLNFPSDAVCLFLEWALAIAASDARLVRLKLADKVLHWLTGASGAWAPKDGIHRAHNFGQARPHADPLSPAGVLSLVGRLVGVPPALVPRLPHDVHVPDCAVGTLEIELSETRRVREFVEARVPPYSRDGVGGNGGEGGNGPRTPAFFDAAGGGAAAAQEDLEHSIPRRLSGWLSTLLERFKADAGGADAAAGYWSSMPLDLARRHLDFCALALGIEALFALHKLPSQQRTIRAAGEVITALAPTLALKKWHPAERATLLAGLSPILVHQPDTPSVEYPVLLDPSPSSGIPASLLPSRPTSTLTGGATVDLDSLEFKHLRVIWAQESTRTALEEVLSALRFILSEATESPTLQQPSASATQTASGSGSSGAGAGGFTQTFPATQASQRIRELEQTQKQDDFGEVRVGSRAANVLGSSSTAAHPGGVGDGSSLRAGAATIQACIKGFITFEMASSGSAARRPVRLQEVVDAILTSPSGADSILIASSAFAAASAGLVQFGLAQAESILQHLGEELLPDYRYARDERFARTALQFLECTMGLWVEPTESAEEFAGDARTLAAWYTNQLRRKIVASWRVRLQFTAFLDKYLSLDPFQQFWDIGGNALRSEDGRLITPTAIIPFMLTDKDFRVRFRASSSSAALFNLCDQLGIPEQQLFADIRSNLTYNLSETEKMLTQILCNANIMIVGESRRRAPYQLLIKTANESPQYTAVTIAALEGVAARLGFDSLAEMYLPYARYFLWLEMREDSAGADIGQRLAYRCCGYPTLRDVRKADFTQTASLILQRPDALPAFRTICDVLKRSEQQGRLACFPETLSLAILRFHDEHKNNLHPPYDALRQELFDSAAAAGAGDAHQQDKLIESVVDEIFAETIALTFELSWPAEGVLPALVGDKRASDTFRALLSLPEDLRSAVEPPPPHWPTHDSVRACIWLDKERHIFAAPAVVFSVVHNLLGKIHRAHFVAEQRRQLLNLAVAMALCHRGLKEHGILATLADGLISLLPQFELVTLVPSMLRWCFREWLALDEKAPSPQHRSVLCEQLVRAAHASMALVKPVAESKIDHLPRIVSALRTTLVETASRLSARGETTVVEASLLWPTREFSFSGSVADIHEALSSSFAPVSKFGIAGALREHEDYAAMLEREDRGRILWRLMQAIEPNATLSSKDCFAFADLLYDVEGEAEAPGVEALNISYQQVRSDAEAEGETGIKKVVADQVLRHLNDPDRKLAAAAFTTAKLVFSVPGADTLFAQDQRSSNAVFAAYLAEPSLQRPLNLRRRLPRKLSELATGDILERVRDFPRWVKALAELLADARAEGDDFYAQLVPLIQLSPAFAKEVVPYLIHSILVQGSTAGDGDADPQISALFTRVLKNPASSPDAIRLVVETAIYLRKHGRPDLAETSRSRFDSWLGVEWLLLAEGAVKTGAYLAGLLLLELAHEYNGLFTTRSDGSAYNPRLDERGQALLYDIYAEIDEPDGFYGRESPDVRQALLRRYRHEGQWDGAFRTYGAQHEAQTHQSGGVDSSATAGVVTSLASFGFNRLAMSVYQPARLEGTLQAQDVPADLPYELAWRTDVWDLPIERQAAGSSSVSLYSALRACRTARSSEATHLAVASAMVSEVQKLSAVTLDLPRPNQEALSTILALREVERLAELKENDRIAPELRTSLASVPSRFSFQQAERVLSSRISILRGIRTKERVDQVGDDLMSASDLYKDAAAAERACLVKLSRVARRSGQLQAAFNAVTLAHSLVEDANSFAIDEELANVLWQQGEHVTAIQLLTSVHHKSSRKQAAIYARLGAWTAEARLRNAQQILTESFEPAVRALERNAPDRAVVYHSFAVFADAQFADLQKTLSEKSGRAQQYKQRKELEAVEIGKQLRSGSMSSDMLQRSRSNADAHIAEDARQVEELEQSTKTMLWRSVENYAKCLASSDDYDDKVFRLTALWFSRAEDDEIHASLKPLLKDIPSHKFVFLAYQLSARLSKSAQPTASASNIRSLVTRLCTEHPFHALPPVHALCDKSKSKSSRRSSTTRDEAPTNTSRAQAALEVIEKVKKADAALRARVEQVELALEAYAEWAGYDIKHDERYSTGRHLKKGSLEILRSMKLRTKVVNLDIPVTSYDLPVDRTGRYEPGSFPTIKGYESHFSTAGGIHLPKICVCLGSDGKKYKQLLKGDDDIRQDAVMEQVFSLVNSLLAKDEGGRRRRLKIRTYKVVPLQSQNGLLEFAANTQPLGASLNRLYDQMAPQIASKARATLYEIEKRNQRRPDVRDAEKKEAFRTIMKDFPPLLRYLFWQRHKVPSLWFDMRLNYSRSVATTSIIGHIVGLGDRHVSNILMDEASGELVHIDFGIAFDQGKRLPIPELVPFRLTHNLIDGFGMSGLEGVFRRCSEETLRVLRDRSSVIMTVLEVFKYDPLQNWAVSADMAKRIQGSGDDEAGGLDELPDDADRALAIVRSKLDTRLSVQYTVNQLIQEATDMDNLAVIFSGWQPYY